MLELSDIIETGQIFSKYHISLDKAALGYRVNVSVYANTETEAIDDTIKLLKEFYVQAQKNDILLVPINEPENKKTVEIPKDQPKKEIKEKEASKK